MFYKNCSNAPEFSILQSTPFDRFFIGFNPPVRFELICLDHRGLNSKRFWPVWLIWPTGQTARFSERYWCCCFSQPTIGPGLPVRSNYLVRSFIVQTVDLHFPTIDSVSFWLGSLQKNKLLEIMWKRIRERHTTKNLPTLYTKIGFQRRISQNTKKYVQSGSLWQNRELIKVNITVSRKIHGVSNRGHFPENSTGKSAKHGIFCSRSPPSQLSGLKIKKRLKPSYSFKGMQKPCAAVQPVSWREFFRWSRSQDETVTKCPVNITYQADCKSVYDGVL